jgi:hypothetical protein
MIRSRMNRVSLTTGLLVSFFTLWSLLVPMVVVSEEGPKKLNPYTGNEKAFREGK